MLLETPYKIGDTISFKLNTGEEVVARLDAESDTHISVKKPMTLIAQQQGLGLAPFMFSVSADAKFEIRLRNVTCIAKTVDDIAKQYTAQTSGIHMVTNNGGIK